MNLYELTDAATALVLETVTVSGAEVAPGKVEGKVRVEGEKEMVAWVEGDSVPVTVMACWVPGALCTLVVISTCSESCAETPLRAATGANWMVSVPLALATRDVPSVHSPAGVL